MTPAPALLPRPVRPVLKTGAVTSVLKTGSRKYARKQPGKREDGANVSGVFSTSRNSLIWQTVKPWTPPVRLGETIRVL